MTFRYPRWLESQYKDVIRDVISDNSHPIFPPIKFYRVSPALFPVGLKRFKVIMSEGVESQKLLKQIERNIKNTTSWPVKLTEYKDNDVIEANKINTDGWPIKFNQEFTATDVIAEKVIALMIYGCAYASQELPKFWAYSPEKRDKQLQKVINAAKMLDYEAKQLDVTLPLSRLVPKNETHDANKVISYTSHKRHEKERHIVGSGKNGEVTGNDIWANSDHDLLEAHNEALIIEKILKYNFFDTLTTEFIPALKNAQKFRPLYGHTSNVEIVHFGNLYMQFIDYLTNEEFKQKAAVVAKIISMVFNVSYERGTVTASYKRFKQYTEDINT